MLYLGLFKYVHIHTRSRTTSEKRNHELEGEWEGVNGRFGAEKGKGGTLSL